MVKNDMCNYYKALVDLKKGNVIYYKFKAAYF